MSAEVRASIIDGGTASFWRKENAAKLVVWKLMKLIIAFGWRKFVVRMNYGKVKETALKMGLLAKEEVGEKKSSTYYISICKLGNRRRPSYLRLREIPVR